MIHYRKDTDNIVTLVLDMDGRNNNIINHEIGEAFLPVIQHLQQEKLRGGLRGVILTSDKKTFLAGGDLEYLVRTSDAAEIFRFSEKLKAFLRALESPGVPVVAALSGSALGTGFEVALGCHHRIAIHDPKMRLGLPEVNIGLMPGAGGIIRLMWLLGIEQAFPILAKGRSYAPHEALKVGIIDELAHDKKDMMERAKAWIMSTQEGRRPWDKKGSTIPGGTAKDVLMATTIRNMAARLCAETHNNYPAPRTILNVMAEGSRVDFDTACRIESRYYTELLQSPECRNMIKAFWTDLKAIKSGMSRPKGFGRFRPKKVGIIGSGIMGSGIALACLRRGMSVVLKDVSKPIAERGRDFVRQKLMQLVEAGTILPQQKEEMLKRITTTDTSADFEACDLVIEAVFENEMVKQKVTREAEEHLDEYAIFGTNTISIPITQLAKASVRPDNYVGLHFFHPADEVPLVEIVRGKQTSEETIARAFDFVTAIKKTPIVVKDDWGFYAARVQNTYILEGITLLKEGYSPSLIENLGRQAGMPKGALAMADDLGLHFVLKYEQQAAAHYGTRYIVHPAVETLNLMLGDLQRHGRHKRAGFYLYMEGGQRQLWPALGEHFPVQVHDYDRQEVIERLLFTQVLEAVWCMQEGVIQSVPAANLGSIYGWGFPAFKGGVIQYVHDYGLAAFTARCKVYEQRYGQRFKVPSKLHRLVVEELEGAKA